MTHLAICASQDWARMDKIVVGNYVTASQAQRKWYTKVISKVSSGNYKLGAVSSPCIVCARDDCSHLAAREELGEHHSAEPPYWTARRREDASLRSIGHPSLVQGTLAPFHTAGRFAHASLQGWKSRMEGARGMFLVYLGIDGAQLIGRQRGGCSNRFPSSRGSSTTRRSPRATSPPLSSSTISTRTRFSILSLRSVRACMIPVTCR